MFTVGQKPAKLCQDQEAERLILAEGYKLKDMPLRLKGGASRFVREHDVFGFKVKLPDVGAAFGFGYQPRYHYLPKQNAWIILHQNRPPTILPIDPDKPIGIEPETDEAVYQRLRRSMLRDLRGVPRPKPKIKP